MLKENIYVTMSDVKQCPFYGNCDKFETSDCSVNCLKSDNYRYLVWSSNLPESLKHPFTMYWDGCDDEKTVTGIKYVLANVVDFVRGGYNLYCYGSCGTGKTSWAAKIMLYYFEQISKNMRCREVKGIFVNVPHLLHLLKYNMGEYTEAFTQYMKHIYSADIVIWDDLCQTSATAYELQTLYALINYRVSNNLSNIYTSNLSPEDLLLQDDRLHSRVCVLSDCLKFSGEDKRSNNSFLNSIINR
jgi:DNA replication protein DnaC